MSNRERYFRRDLRYSIWCRNGWRELLDLTPEERLRCLSGWGALVDADMVRYCGRCMQPIALVEEAQDVGQPKTVTVTRNLAQMAHLPARCVLYDAEEDGRTCPYDNEVCYVGSRDPKIRRFRVQEISPCQQRGYSYETPKEHAEWIKRIHDEHDAICPMRRRFTQKR